MEPLLVDDPVFFIKSKILKSVFIQKIPVFEKSLGPHTCSLYSLRTRIYCIFPEEVRPLTFVVWTSNMNSYEVKTGYFN